MSMEAGRHLERWFQSWPQRTNVTHVPTGALPDMLAKFRPLTVLISQQNRGGLRAWQPQLFTPDVVVCVPNGDSVAEAVALCVRANAAHGWPLLCVVMGASHAFARINAAARAAYAQGVYVVVVEGP